MILNYSCFNAPLYFALATNPLVSSMHYLRGKCAVIGFFPIIFIHPGYQAVGKTALTNSLVESRKDFSQSYKMVLNFPNLIPRRLSPDLVFEIYNYKMPIQTW